MLNEMQNKVKSTNIYQMIKNIKKKLKKKIKYVFYFEYVHEKKIFSTGNHVIRFIHIKLIKSWVYNQRCNILQTNRNLQLCVCLSYYFELMTYYLHEK